MPRPETVCEIEATKADASISRDRPPVPLWRFTPSGPSFQFIVCPSRRAAGPRARALNFVLSDAATANVAQARHASRCLTPSGCTNANTVNTVHACAACFANSKDDAVGLLDH